MLKALLAAVAASTLVLAPQAHADITMTVQRICSESATGFIPMTVIASPQLACGDPNYWGHAGRVPGLFIAAPASISRVMDRIHPGSYPVDPANPRSDWVVQPGPPNMPAPAPMIACDESTGAAIPGHPFSEEAAGIDGDAGGLDTEDLAGPRRAEGSISTRRIPTTRNTPNRSSGNWCRVSSKKDPRALVSAHDRFGGENYELPIGRLMGRVHPGEPLNPCVVVEKYVYLCRRSRDLRSVIAR